MMIFQGQYYHHILIINYYYSYSVFVFVFTVCFFLLLLFYRLCCFCNDCLLLVLASVSVEILYRVIFFTNFFNLPSLYTSNKLLQSLLVLLKIRYIVCVYICIIGHLYSALIRLFLRADGQPNIT